jgi:hypothetical protein
VKWSEEDHQQLAKRAARLLREDPKGSETWAIRRAQEELLPPLRQKNETGFGPVRILLRRMVNQVETVAEETPPSQVETRKAVEAALRSVLERTLQRGIEDFMKSEEVQGVMRAAFAQANGAATPTVAPAPTPTVAQKAIQEHQPIILILGVHPSDYGHLQAHFNGRALLRFWYFNPKAHTVPPLANLKAKLDCGELHVMALQGDWYLGSIHELLKGREPKFYPSKEALVRGLEMQLL